MLRASGRHYGTDFGLKGIVQGNGGSGVGHEARLLAFADAAIVDPANLGKARAELTRISGEKAMIDAAAVIAGFDAITRVADGSGVPLEQPKAVATSDWRIELGIDAFWAAKV